MDQSEMISFIAMTTKWLQDFQRRYRKHEIGGMCWGNRMLSKCFYEKLKPHARFRIKLYIKVIDLIIYRVNNLMIYKVFVF